MSRYICNVTWDEVPHLSVEEKNELWRSIPSYQRKARSKGLPVLGSGVIYPFDEEQIVIDHFDLPRAWPRVFGLDHNAGAGWTAIVYLAWDRENQIIYLYRDYKSDSKSVADHVDNIRTVGGSQAKHKPLWMPGVGDLSGLLVTENDSAQFLEIYKEKGVDVELPDKAVETGIQDVYDLLQGRRLRVFKQCRDWLTEFRQYHRKDGKIIKKNDHLMDATRYAIHSGLARASVAPQAPDNTPQVLVYDEGHRGAGWMGM
jgi:hypothetical protein